MFCPKCGTRNEDEALFCSNCGFNMSGLAGRVASGAPSANAGAQGESEAAQQRKERIERGREELQKRASEVGGQVSQQASRLGETAKEMAAQVMEGASDLPSSAAEAKARWGTATIARGAICVLAFILLFLPWLEYRGALTGTRSFSLADLWGMDMGAPLLLAVIGVIIMAGGIVAEALARAENGKWAHAAGCFLVIIAAFVTIADGSDSASIYGQTVATVGATAAVWFELLLGIAGIASCFWKQERH